MKPSLAESAQAFSGSGRFRKAGEWRDFNGLWQKAGTNPVELEIKAWIEQQVMPGTTVEALTQIQSDEYQIELDRLGTFQPLDAVMEDSILLKVVTSRQTHEACLAAWLGMVEGQISILLAYMYDLEKFTDAQINVRKRGGAAILVLDVQKTFGKATDGQCTGQQSQILRLEGAGVPVRLFEGASKDDDYAAVGRKCFFRGAHHAKALLAGNILIVGSSNWTTSSKANGEMGVVVKVGPKDLPGVQALFWSHVVRARPYRAVAKGYQENEVTRSLARGGSSSSASSRR